MTTPHQPRLINDEDPEYQLDAAQKEAYRERLRQKLQSPEFRQIEGFPIGEDEDILAISDPPYYTACPNPFLPEIVEEWQEEREQTRRGSGLSTYEENVDYHREPFATDVSEGKSGAIYSAHSYHTKVPHKAVMRYILHYTDPGDIVFDGFCGTGMTGVAAQLCENRKEVENLGYRVNDDGFVFAGDQQISRIGARKSILNDLSPIATFIAHNYNTPVDTVDFQREAQRILSEIKEELGWMYETWHPNCNDANRLMARIDYVVWSDVFACPECSQEIIFVEQALNQDTGRIKKKLKCPTCGTQSKKSDLELIYSTEFDQTINMSTRLPKRVPVFLYYKIGKKQYKKNLDREDWRVLEKIGKLPPPAKIPTNHIPDMQMMRVGRMKPSAISNLHQFFLPRPRQVLNSIWEKISKYPDSRLRSFLYFAFEQTIWTMSLLNRYRPRGYSQVNQYLAGVFYIASQISEVSPWYVMEGKVQRLAKAYHGFPTASSNTIVTTESATGIELSECVDYIFTDPPFGENIYYSDLNYLLESWHKVRTNSEPEAIIDRVKKKTLVHYQGLMRQAFKRFYSILKPGRWMTVEFHNSQNSVWNAIQEALLSAGFMVADVRVLDKKQGSFQQVNSQSAVKQDLVISAYKTTVGFEQRFSSIAGTREGAWEFTREHLAKLPVVVSIDETIESLSERMDYLLFDRMVAFHIQRGTSVPLSASKFYEGLRKRFVERDGMFFLPDQIPEYDKARLQAQNVVQLTLFVIDEKSSIQWLRQQLAPDLGGHPQTYQDIQPKFLKELHQLRHEALPELSEILEQNFLQDEKGRWYVPDPNKASDLEKLRQRALLKEFNEYLKGSKKLKVFRTEAVRAGFAEAWSQNDYATIIEVAEQLPEQVIQEDPDLLMYYDNASLMFD